MSAGERYCFRHRDVQVDVEQRRGSDEADVDRTGCLIWPTSVIFCRYLCDRVSLLQGRRVLDMGAGTGLVGLVASRLGAAVSLVDMPQAMPLLEANVAADAAGRPPAAGATEVLPLLWGNAAHLTELLKGGGRFDVVLCCEVVYQQPPEVLAALRATLRDLLAPEGTLIFAYQQRDGAEFTDAPFFAELPTVGLVQVSEESLCAWDDAWDDVDGRVVRTYRRQEAVASL